jgi:hypothetical protein
VACKDIDRVEPVVLLASCHRDTCTASGMPGGGCLQPRSTHRAGRDLKTSTHVPSMPVSLPMGKPVRRANPPASHNARAWSGLSVVVICRNGVVAV